ncbi:hypothetical protein ACFY1P_20715 [Streptomyces sp. NPDC001407]|uniref:hypothetical protein n=1 Tax=Streptomyces sp. NPDC001407 TaxID=3364573 RepID=UPI0036B2DFCE
MPGALPTWRRRLRSLYGEPFLRGALARALDAGWYDYVPLDRSVGQAVGLIATRQQEQLARARLYIAGPALSQAAVARSSRAMPQPVDTRYIPGWRLGQDCGLMLFAHPLVHVTTLAGNGAVTSPVVAASWSSWPPACAGHDRAAYASGRAPCQRWLIRSRDKEVTRCPGEEAKWLLLTLYHFVPSALVEHARLIGLHDMVGAVGVTRFPLVPAADVLLPLHPSPQTAPALEDGLATASRAVAAAWRLWPRTGPTTAPAPPVTCVAQRPSRQRADRRRGITDDGTVRVVDLPARSRRASRGPRGPRAADTGYVWEERREVEAYDRYTCQNTRLHAQDPGLLLHEHTLEQVRGYTAGPPGAPIRRRETVYRTQ